MLINLEKMRLPVIVKPFILNNQSMCSFTLYTSLIGVVGATFIGATKKN